MPVQTSYPGVYVQEVPSGVRTITGVGTSIGLFIGRTRKGALYQPVQCLSYEDFDRAFSAQYVGSELPRAVRLFFANGGTQCYVARVADEQSGGSTLATASVKLLTEAKADALLISSLSPGAFGNDIRVTIDYNTDAPESSFNLEVWRWTSNSLGAQVKTDVERYLGLSMNPAHPRYVQDVVTQQSRLISAKDVSTAPTAADIGFSLGARPIAANSDAVFLAEVQALFDKSAGPRKNFQFRVSVDGAPAQLIDLGDLDFTIAPLNTAAGIVGNLETAIQNLINAKVSPSAVSVKFVTGPNGQVAPANNASTRLLRIASAKGDVVVDAGPDPSTDIAAALMLGTSRGGAEVSRWAKNRPASNGLVFQPDYFGGSNAVAFAQRLQSDINVITIGGRPVQLTGVNTLRTTPTTASPPATAIGANAKMFQDLTTVQPAAPPDMVSDGVREKWQIIAAAVIAARANDPAFAWSAQVWGSRLAIVAADGSDNISATLSTGPNNIGGSFNANVRAYSLGTTGAGAFQAAGVQGKDGGPPSAADYERAYQEVDRQVDLFNLLVLPKDDGHGDSTTRMLWGPASVFCQRRRAFLLIDPPSNWSDSQAAAGPMVGVNTLRVGLVKDHAAVFYPRLKINEGGKDVFVGPAGAIAGLMGRIDGTRGVWKAPAGTEADLRGITGVEKRFSDGENGVMNPKAINTIRVFPNGIVNWGARTMDGDDAFGSEYKYIPIRRLALYMEESLYRGLKWVVFEPNDEPLWAQIRLNVGAFMNNLFRQGAFQGQTPKDAYFVKCDASTTTQNDRNLGIVNVVVGFAPLKPAEFVVLTLQQIAGQIQV
ncbi:phage tail sheath subtilisin-like domain-containing protein [Paucibacter sp. APW11]|uniref:Phage tail sheath subtilisin-like domain-containing protein n=1 Tax=Roseateles aquae TaxID=3077235 RepID=A0ABU3P982_9BURK|nr:phage tail sheath C-terminal domain-containing protein [Paucibacter sp. APW11]MDT8999136.1 phage tail sheath subtilisin-like domain-containing protein [Paucibacter sp. APW11]